MCTLTDQPHKDGGAAVLTGLQRNRSDCLRALRTPVFQQPPSRVRGAERPQVRVRRCASVKRRASGWRRLAIIVVLRMR